MNPNKSVLDLSGEVPPTRKNLIKLFSKTGRKYKPQDPNEPWIVFRVWVASVGKGYIGACKDRGDDFNTMTAVCKSLFYDAKRRTEEEARKHPLFSTIRDLDDTSHMEAEILAHCDTRYEALALRKMYIKRLRPALNMPGYIREHIDA